MKGLKVIGPAVIVCAALLVPAGTASARDCGDQGRITDIVANGVGCAQAKRVTKRWKSLCNYAGRCQVEGGGTGDQWSCKGSRRGSILKMRCIGSETEATVRFNAPA